MANNYCQFSATIECVSEEDAECLVEILEAEDEDPIFLDHCQIEATEDSVAVWVAAEECGDPEALAAGICKWQNEVGSEMTAGFEFSLSCSKPRISEFGGGAVVCYKGEAHWVNTWSWIEDKIKDLTGG